MLVLLNGSVGRLTVARARGRTTRRLQGLADCGGSVTKVPLNNTSLVKLAPLLAGAGFDPAAPLPVPASATDIALIAASAFAPAPGYRWGGTKFVP